MKFFRIFHRIFLQSKYAFLFSLGIYFLSLLLNTSFRVMGFDLSSQLESIFNPDYGIVIVATNGKIFLLYYIFFSTIQLILKDIYTDFKIQKEKYIPIFLAIIFFFWVYSIVKHPQLYSDFFYGRHSYLRFFLYVCTDFLYIDFFPYIVNFITILLPIYYLFRSLQKKKLKSFVTFVFILVSLLFHYHGVFFGVLLSFLVWKILYFEDRKISFSILIPLYSALLLFISAYIYTFYFFSYSKLQFNAPPLLLISADSLRKDMIGKEVKGKSITPHIDAFLKESVSFEDHHVTIPRTFPSWADLLTGEFSMHHKIRDMFPAPSEIQNLGSPQFPTIGHYLQSKGFGTAVFSNFAGDIFPRADFGFQEIFAPTFNAKVLLVQKSLESQIFLLPILTGLVLGGGEYFSEIHSFASLGDGEFILQKLFPYLRLHKNRPFFATAFFSVTHFPYSPPYPFYKKFADKDYYGNYKYFKFVDPTVDSKPSEEDVRQIRAIFYASVNSFDDNFGKLIQYLKEENLYDNMTIVLTGDHGESLYEDIHGQGHGEHLRGDAITHVPLVIKLPSAWKEKNASACTTNSNCLFTGITSSVDLLPTLLNLYSIEPSKELPGRKLFPISPKLDWDDDRAVYAETGIWFSDIGDHFFQKQRIMYPNILKMHRIVPEENYQIMITDSHYRNTIAFAKHRAILTKQYKFIYIPTHDGVIYELFDRKKDPDNTVNLYTNERGKRYREELIRLSQIWENSKIISDYIFPERLDE